MNPANKWLVGTISASLLGGAGLWEGTKFYAYKDIAGIPTVCSGYTGSGIIFGRKYSKEECDNYTRTELAKHGQGVLNCTTVPLNQHQYNAYTLFAYNVGVGGFCGSRAAKLLNQGKYTDSCNALVNGPKGELVWVYVKGQYVKGLHNRRLYEVEMCKGTNEVDKDDKNQMVDLSSRPSRAVGTP